MSRRSIQLALVCLMLVPAVAFAQSPPEVEGMPERPTLDGEVRALVKQPVPKPRSDAPIPIEIVLEYRSEKILRGHLEMELIYGGRPRMRLQSPEIVVTRDKRSERFFLPPFDVYAIDEGAQIKIALVTKERRYEIEAQRLSAPSYDQRQQVVGLVDVSVGNTELAMALNLTQFRAEEKDKSLIHFPARLEPSRMPVEPLEYCVFDILILTPDALALANERALQAVATWARAGGSVLVLCGEGLAQRHASFLNDVTGLEGFTLGPDGRLTLDGEPPPSGFSLYKPELGRSVVTFDPVNVDELLPQPQWIEVLCHLWKVRTDQTRTILSSSPHKWREPETVRNEDDPFVLAAQVARAGNGPQRLSAYLVGTASDGLRAGTVRLAGPGQRAGD